LASSAVVRSYVFDVRDFRPDIFSGSLAEGNLGVHLSADVVNIVVDHWQGHTYGKHGDNAEGNSRVGDKSVSFDPTLFHGGLFGLVYYCSR
jgi:hypothetical protein